MVAPGATKNSIRPTTCAVTAHAMSMSMRSKLGPEVLPSLPKGEGVFIVTTTSGTVHVLKLNGLWTWERRPAPDALRAAYDGRPAVIQTLHGFEAGGQGAIEVRDGGYLYGATLHRTATIVSIQRDLRSCQTCGRRLRPPIGCWRCKLDPGHVRRTRMPHERWNRHGLRAGLLVLVEAAIQHADDVRYRREIRR